MKRVINLRRRVVLATTTLLVGGLLLTAPAASATTFQKGETSCAPYMVINTACFKEDTTGGNELLIQQGIGQIGNLGALSVSVGDGTCNGGIFNNSTWNDCISYVAYNIASGNELCVWNDASYSGTLLWWVSGPANGTHVMSGSENDNISSISVESIGGGFC